MSSEQQENLEESLTLFKTPIFRFVFWLTLVASLVTFGIISHHDKIIFTSSFGADDALLFIDSFKLPIGIWAVGLPILLLLATQHRSEQTAK
jgi:hypothetical protein